MKTSQKRFVVPSLIGIITLLVIGGIVYIHKSKKVEVTVVTNNTVNLPVNNQENTLITSGVQAGSYVQYKPFSTTKDIKTLAIYNLKKSDKLPLSITVDGDLLVIKSIDIVKTKLASTTSFQGYITVIHKGLDEKIGFWYSNTNPNTDISGCGENNCGGILTIQTQQTESNPTAQEVQNGISMVMLTKYIGISSLEYNFETSDWKNIEISLQLLRETVTRNITN